MKAQEVETATAPAAIRPLPVLLVRSGGWVIALPLAHVVETMRLLPVEPLDGMPPFVLGLSIIRGAPVPVVDLKVLLGRAAGESAATRIVTVRTGDRRVALAVERVIGVRELDAASLEPMPPLLRQARSDLAAAVGALDDQLMMVLQTGRVISDDVWDALQSHGTLP